MFVPGRAHIAFVQAVFCSIVLFCAVTKKIKLTNPQNWFKNKTLSFSHNRGRGPWDFHSYVFLQVQIKSKYLEPSINILIAFFVYYFLAIYYMY